MKKKITEIIEYLALLIFYYFSKLIGLRISSFTGGVVMSIYGMLSGKNDVAIKNLDKIFPNKNVSEKKKIVHKMWFHFGRVIGEYPHLENIKTLTNKNISIRGLNNLINGLEKNRNCLFFSAHLGNWELTSHPLTESGYNISFIYRAPNNKLVDNLLRKIRNKYGVKLIKKGSEGAKDCISVLKREGGNIGMLIDQKMNDGIEAKFFNYKTMTASAIAKFSLKYKCPIIPAVCVRKRGVQFEISYLPEVSYEKIVKLKTELNIMNYLNSYVEKWIKECPDQWIWIHNRW